MRQRFPALAGAAAMALLFCFALANVAMAAPAERWIHVKVDDTTKGELVRVNVPLSFAEKVLPTINHGELRDGKVRIGAAHMDDVDLRALLDAIRTAPDNEFVTVQSKDEDVRVAKSNGNLVVHVRDTRKDDQKVDITVPMTVVDALLKSGSNELDLVAAIHVLENLGDTTLVTIHDATQNVRIWVDSRNTAE